MDNISISEKNGDYFFRLPYELKDQFRTLFKSATWNGVEKAFVVKATTANKNKWQKFLDGAESLRAEFAQAEHHEATERELAALAESLEKKKDELNRKIAIGKENAITLLAKVIEIREKISELKPLQLNAAEKEEEVALAVAEAEEELAIAVAPAVALFQRHGLNAILAKLLKASYRDFAGKVDRGDAQEALKVVRNDLKTIGFKHPLIDELCRHSLNRPEKFIEDIPCTKEKLLTALEAI